MSRPTLVVVPKFEPAERWEDLITRCTWIIVEHVIKGDLRTGVVHVFNAFPGWQKDGTNTRN